MSERRSHGFTLIEVIFTVVLTTMIGGVVAAALLTSTNASHATTDQVNDSNDLGLVSTFLVRDAQSAGGIDPATALPQPNAVSKTHDGGCTAAGALKVRFSWTDRGPGATAPVVVTYRLTANPDGGSSNSLIRRICQSGTSTDTMLAAHVAAVDVSCLPMADCTGAPTWVLMTVTGSGAGAPVTGTLRAALRTSRSQLAIVAPNVLADAQQSLVYTPQQFDVIGGAVPLSWSATGLPPGLSISPTGSLTGVPQNAGAYTVTAAVVDGSGATTSRAFALSVLPRLTITGPNAPDGSVGAAYNATMQATGGKTPYAWTASGLPPGLTMSSNGMISGTPTQAGTYSVSISASDSMGAAAAPWLQTITIGGANYCPWPETNWTGQYFANATLSGSPAYTQSDATIDFDWGAGGPAGLPVNNFSIRWTKLADFTAASYTFSLTADTGARLYLDNVLLIDKWSSTSTGTSTRTLFGTHLLRVDYRETTGSAKVKLTATSANATLVANNGVSVSTVTNGDGYYGEDGLVISSPSYNITALSVTISIAPSPTLGGPGQWQDFPSSSQTSVTTAGCGWFDVYTWNTTASLTKGTYNVRAQWHGDGVPHPTAGDRWTVTVTTSKGTSTLSGTFS